ncbi:MAG: DUF4188 domain-containing protein [Bacteroidetes bacterium]|nr:DUF4188 domain-containing protein [Bacteroidota bacterium]
MWLKGAPPEKDYYAVIFISTKEEDLTGYYEMDNKLMELAQTQIGFLGWENVKKDNQSIFISYWENMEAINNWRINSTHLTAKAQVSKWYKRYLSQICKVEHSKLFEK